MHWPNLQTGIKAIDSIQKNDRLGIFELKIDFNGENVMNQKFDMKLKMKNPQSGEDMEIPIVVNSVTNMTVIKK